ncbi:AraC family transcriptional regulator [Pendulispora brunnea]|uniref:AraC family transcriptional regulator n=1 Tax=Pendulispora brunnea TaxID=2905690 RepID=A0ABZ2KIM8_9BACT
MTERPIQRDDLRGDGSPIFVLRRRPDDVPRVRAEHVTHQFAALEYCTAGRLRMEQPEAWTLEAGEALLVPAGQPHRAIARAGFESWHLGFCVSCVVADDAGLLLEPFERVRAGASPVVRLPAARRAFLETLFAELQEATDPARYGESRAVAHSLLTLVLNEVGRAARAEGSPPAPAGLVAEALRFIERHCRERITLGDVAAAVGRSPAYVTTALSQATGRSAVEWIVAGRMAEARRMLLHSDEMVDIIAERVGYADPTHFIRMFRRAHGTTPAAWRASKRRDSSRR